MGGDWEVQAKYMRGTCVVRARYKPDTGRVEARGLGRGSEGKASLKSEQWEAGDS